DAEFPILEDGEPLASLLVNPLERFDDEAASDPETVMPPEEPEKGESPQHKKQRLEEGGSSQAGHVEIAPSAGVSDVRDADMPSVAEKHMTEQHPGDASPQKRPRIEARKKPRLEPDVSLSEAPEASEPSGMVVGCIIGEDEYFHGDELLDIEVEGTHQPALLDHEVTLQDEMQQMYTSEKAADRLWRPVGPGGKEPEMSVEELAELDELAKEEELARLSKIPALIPMTADEGQMLWCQQRLKRGEFELASVPTVYNVADLNTKCLAKGRVQFLRYMLGCVKFDEDGSQHGVWLNVGQDEYDTFEEKEKAKQLIRQIRAEIGARPEFQATGSTTTTNLAKRIFAAGMMRLLVQAGDASKLDDDVDALGRRGVEPNSSDNGNQSAVHLEWTTQDTLEVIATLYVCICVLTCSCRHVWWLWQQMNVFIAWCRRCEQSKALQKTTILESEESDVNSEQIQKVQSACSSGSRAETVLRESSNAA
ncbi:unnamed protein product, partial [Effrenium voratum]